MPPCDYDGRRSLASTAPRETSAEDARIPEEGLTSTASGDDGTQSLVRKLRQIKDTSSKVNYYFQDNRIARIVEIKLAEAAARQRLGSYPSPQRGPRTLSIEGPSDNLGLPNQ
ncbi:hypothetical protein DH86_00000859 [Scytalidium sp. 3C]|nr:hypothetical protein DH86_00000859 [Scytalidium sp. 3C]